MSNPSTPSTTSNPCAITGQPDIYGLGIRFSLYLQWYTGILAYVYSRSEAHLPITANYLLAIAVAIACMVHHDDIYSLEIMIVAILVMVPPLALLMVLGEFLLFVYQHRKSEIEEPEDPEYPITELVAHIGVLLGTGFLLGVMVWGFFYGPDVMMKAEGCTPMFAGSKYLEGTYAIGLKIWSVALIVFAITTIIFFMWYRWRLYSVDNDKLTRLTRLVAKFVKAEHSQSPLKTKFRYFRPVAVVFCGGVVSTCVMTIELVIYQNQIQGVGDVTSAGQLIPLTIGLASFGLMIFEAYRSYKNKHSKQKGDSSPAPVSKSEAGPEALGNEPHVDPEAPRAPE